MCLLTRCVSSVQKENRSGFRYWICELSFEFMDKNQRCYNRRFGCVKIGKAWQELARKKRRALLSNATNSVKFLRTKEFALCALRPNFDSFFNLHAPTCRKTWVEKIFDRFTDPACSGISSPFSSIFWARILNSLVLGFGSWISTIVITRKWWIEN